MLIINLKQFGTKAYKNFTLTNTMYVASNYYTVVVMAFNRTKMDCLSLSPFFPICCS